MIQHPAVLDYKIVENYKNKKFSTIVCCKIYRPNISDNYVVQHPGVLDHRIVEKYRQNNSDNHVVQPPGVLDHRIVEKYTDKIFPTIMTKLKVTCAKQLRMYCNVSSSRDIAT